jgi:hypothetical protein
MVVKPIPAFPTVVEIIPSWQRSTPGINGSHKYASGVHRAKSVAESSVVSSAVSSSQNAKTSPLNEQPFYATRNWRIQLRVFLAT